jgi:hypothetical protein
MSTKKKQKILPHFAWKDFHAYKDPDPDEENPKSQEELWTDALLDAMLNKLVKLYVSKAVLERVGVTEFKEDLPRITSRVYCAYTELYPVIRAAVRARQTWKDGGDGVVFKFGDGEELYMDILPGETVGSHSVPICGPLRYP